MSKIIHIAAKYSVDPRTVYTWIKKGCPHRFEPRKTPLGKPVIRLNADEVQAWIDAHNAEKKGSQS